MTEILDEGAVSEIEATGWKKGFPDLDGDYYCRVDEYDRQPTLIRIESRSSFTSAAVYEFGCGDDLRREYEAEEEYEYLGPLDPESVPALCHRIRFLKQEHEKAFSDFRSHAMQLCKDKAAEWQLNSNDYNDKDGMKHSLIAKAAAARELGKELEKL